MRIVLLLALSLLSACMTGAPAGAGAGEVVSIAYETGPCFGACPVYAVSVSREGRGTFEGRRFTAVTGRRAFVATPAQFAAFAKALEPVRPEQPELRIAPGARTCERAATDMPSTEVRWTLADGSTRRLYFYHGCDMAGATPYAKALKEAPAALPIGAFIGVQR